MSEDIVAHVSEATLEDLVQRDDTSAERGYYTRLLGLVMDHGSNGLGLSRLDVAGLLRALPDAIMDRCAEMHGIKDQSEIRIAIHESDDAVMALVYHTHPDHIEACQIGVLRLTIDATDATAR